MRPRLPHVLSAKWRHMRVPPVHACGPNVRRTAYRCDEGGGGAQAIMAAGAATAAALFALAASPLMPVKAYALFAGMAVLAQALVASTLFPPARPGRAPRSMADPFLGVRGARSLTVGGGLHASARCVRTPCEACPAVGSFSWQRRERVERRLELLGPQVLVIWSEHWEELPCCVCAPWMLRRSYADRLEERKCAPPVPGMPRGALGEQPRFVSSCGAATSIDTQV